MIYFKKTFFLIAFLLLFFSGPATAKQLPKLFLFVENHDLKIYKKILKNPYITGVQKIYKWRSLEPEKGIYDFSAIEKDLYFLNSMHKKLFIQLQDRTFQPNAIPVPDYIREEKIYRGGIAKQYDKPGQGKLLTEGWATRVWDPAVDQRFRLLVQKLAQKFDGKIYGINLPETAVDFDLKNIPQGFTHDNYFYAELENIGFLKKEFQRSIVIQYVNFMPGEWNNDHNYMGRLFLYAFHHQIGLGGPDVIPYKKQQMKNSYPFFLKYKGKIIIGMAVQEGDYTYKNPRTGSHYTFHDFYSFATDYLGATIIFWNMREPFFSKQLMPNINNRYFNQN